MAGGYWHICDENTTYDSTDKKYVLKSPANHKAIPGISEYITNKVILFDFKNIKAEANGTETDCGAYVGEIAFAPNPNDNDRITANFSTDRFDFIVEIGFGFTPDGLTATNEFYFYATAK